MRRSWGSGGLVWGAGLGGARTGLAAGSENRARNSALTDCSCEIMCHSIEMVCTCSCSCDDMVDTCDRNNVISFISASNRASST